MAKEYTDVALRAKQEFRRAACTLRASEGPGVKMPGFLGFKVIEKEL
jgi:hypothetical protein